MDRMSADRSTTRAGRENGSGLPRAARIGRVIRENARTVSLVTSTSIDAEPGQFCMIWLPGLDEKPFSIAEREPLTFTVSRVGPFSAALQELSSGDRLWFRGPFGKGFTLSKERAVLAGGGYGAAPLYFLARELLNPGRLPPAARPLIALGAKSAADLLFLDRFASLGLEVKTATEDGSRGTKGLVTDVVRPILEEGAARRLYACGPEGMLVALASLCGSTGVPAELSHEAYMRCGVGVCGSCQHGPSLVCMDGPVFSLAAGSPQNPPRPPSA
jgi:dihydroorotate dehydrogenase electron transfer subunit